jgi:hypothetical protein
MSTLEISLQQKEEPEHLVQFYENNEELIETIKEFISTGDAIILIAKKSRKKAIEKNLHIQGLSLEKATKQRHYIFIDAEEMLSKFMVDSLPHPKLFQKTVGALVERVTKSHTNIRAFGEMVSVLWDEGNTPGAIMLEELWNDLQKEYKFSLLCAYPSYTLESTRTQHVSYMCSCHSAVLSPKKLLNTPL